jgi:hypothetical protein
MPFDELDVYIEALNDSGSRGYPHRNLPGRA